MPQPIEPIYKVLASLVDARANCRKNNNNEWYVKHTDQILKLVREFMPSGSGWDNATKIDTELSTGEKLVFQGAFHHMNDVGYYDGWTDHTITVRGSLQFGFDISISGRNRNDIKTYLHDIFREALRQRVQWDADQYVRIPD